jgi:hypothetical protein
LIKLKKRHTLKRVPIDRILRHGEGTDAVLSLLLTNGQRVEIGTPDDVLHVESVRSAIFAAVGVVIPGCKAETWRTAAELLWQSAEPAPGGFDPGDQLRVWVQCYLDRCQRWRRPPRDPDEPPKDGYLAMQGDQEALVRELKAQHPAILGGHVYLTTEAFQEHLKLFRRENISGPKLCARLRQAGWWHGIVHSPRKGRERRLPVKAWRSPDGWMGESEETVKDEGVGTAGNRVGTAVDEQETLEK